jgi:hypothetical protein
MEIKSCKARGLFVALAIAALGGGYLEVRSLRETQNSMRSEEAFSAILDRLAQVRQINASLKWLEAGDVDEAAQHLNLLLSENIVRANSQLAFADARARFFVQRAFGKMALYQPTPSGRSLDVAAPGRSDDEREAQRILALAVLAGHGTNETASAAR